MLEKSQRLQRRSNKKFPEKYPVDVDCMFVSVFCFVALQLNFVSNQIVFSLVMIHFKRAVCAYYFASYFYSINKQETV